MKRNSPSYVPVVESLPEVVSAADGRKSERGQAPAGITDVLTIGEESTVFRVVQRALRPTGWAIAHVGNVGAARAYLRRSVAAVVVAEADLAPEGWPAMVAALRNVEDAPEVVLVTGKDLALQDVLKAGAFDLLKKPFDHSDLLWAVATAWTHFMTQRNRGFGGGRCSDA